MTRVKLKIFVGASLLIAFVSACGNNAGDSKITTTTAVVQLTQAPVVPDTIEVDSTTTSPETATVDDEIARIEVTVGIDSGPDRIENVAVGRQIELTIVNPEDDDEFHVHGYDLGGDETAAGEEKVFAFTATEAGDFEVESHATGEVLVVIRVS